MFPKFLDWLNEDGRRQSLGKDMEGGFPVVTEDWDRTRQGSGSEAAEA